MQGITCVISEGKKYTSLRIGAIIYEVYLTTNNNDTNINKKYRTMKQRELHIAYHFLKALETKHVGPKNVHLTIQVRGILGDPKGTNAIFQRPEAARRTRKIDLANLPVLDFQADYRLISGEQGMIGFTIMEGSDLPFMRYIDAHLHHKSDFSDWRQAIKHINTTLQSRLIGNGFLELDLLDLVC